MGGVSNVRERTCRFELKFRLTYAQYCCFRNSLVPYMKQDRFTGGATGGRYYVRSLYFDTYDHSAYHEKMNGNCDRVKFRLRSYSALVHADTRVRVELKVRRGNVMDKYSAFASFDDYKHFMQHRHWPENDKLILSEFERYVHLHNLQPLVLVEYWREGFEDRSKEDLRITFDHKVRSAHANTLFPSNTVFSRTHHPYWVVLEIKGSRTPPAWLRRLARGHGLKVVANSKFAQGIQAGRQDLLHPNGVVVIR